MGIVTPAWYQAPWASNQALALLSPERMAAGFPSGLAQRPTRQDLNRALEFAVNGVLYYLAHGIPAWVAEAQYPTGSVVMYAGRYWRANALVQGVEPGGAGWEALLWRRAELDAVFLAHDVGDALFVNAATADARFYPRAEMDATFITPAAMAAQFAPVSSLLPLLTRLMANAQFVTQAQGDARWALLADSVPLGDLAALLLPLLSRTDASANFISTLEPQPWLNGQTAPSIFVTKTQAAETMQDKETAAISVYNPEKTYRAGVLALEQGRIYRSQANDNLGNVVTDPAWWKPWSLPTHRPTESWDGRFLNLMRFETPTANMIAVTTAMIPEVSMYPDGIPMKFWLKGAGGNVYATDVAYGAGEGKVLEVVTRVKASDFPMYLHVGDPLTDTGHGYSDPTAIYDTATPTPGDDQHLSPNMLMAAGSGYRPTPQEPGAGNESSFVHDRFEKLTWIRRNGTAGRHFISGVRWGDGGGVHGASALPVTTPQISPTPPAFYGCGAAAGPGQPNYGGAGIIEIAWPKLTEWRLMKFATFATSSAAMDTTGADLIVVIAATHYGSAPSDSQNNTWQVHAAGYAPVSQIAYCIHPTTSTQHTFQGTGSYEMHIVCLFKAPAFLAVDQRSTATSVPGITTIQVAPITPAPKSLVISAVGNNNARIGVVDSDFILIQTAQAGASYDAGAAFRIANDASPFAPTWTLTANPSGANATMLSFRGG